MAARDNAFLNSTQTIAHKLILLHHFETNCILYLILKLNAMSKHMFYWNTNTSSQVLHLF